MLRKRQSIEAEVFTRKYPSDHLHHDEVDATRYSSEEVSDHNLLSEYDWEPDGLIDKNC